MVATGINKGVCPFDGVLGPLLRLGSIFIWSGGTVKTQRKKTLERFSSLLDVMVGYSCVQSLLELA